MNSELKPLTNIHHAVYRCRDAEETRAFYVDILGLKLAAAFEDTQDFGEALGGKRHFLHMFFETPDGNYIAFFDEPGKATPDHFKGKDSFDLHLALEVENLDAVLRWQEQLNAVGITCMGPVDHGFVQSVYMYDPNGIPLEITARVSDSAEVMAQHAAEAGANLAKWTRSTAAIKRERLGFNVSSS